MLLESTLSLTAWTRSDAPIRIQEKASLNSRKSNIPSEKESEHSRHIRSTSRSSKNSLSLTSMNRSRKALERYWLSLLGRRTCRFIWRRMAGALLLQERFSSRMRSLHQMEYLRHSLRSFKRIVLEMMSCPLLARIC